MPTPVPDDVLAAMVTMCFQTMPDYYRAPKLRGVVTWEIAGPAGGRWQTVLGDGTCTVIRDGHAAEDLRVAMSATDFIALCLGVKGGTSLYLGGRMQATGSRILLARLARAFASPLATPPA